MRRAGLLAAGLLLVDLAAATGQQLTPRVCAPAPADLKVGTLPAAYQTGSVITDPSLPVQNVDAKVESATASYERTFGFFGRSANAAVVVPGRSAIAVEVFERTRSATRGHSIEVAWSKGATVRLGQDFTTTGITYQDLF